jgi:hypothetical protein
MKLTAALTASAFIASTALAFAFNVPTQSSSSVQLIQDKMGGKPDDKMNKDDKMGGKPDDKMNKDKMGGKTDDMKKN